MSHPLYMDQHVPAAITQGLRDRGIDVLTAHEDAYSERSDQEILARGLELGRIIFTLDADFLSLARDCWLNGKPFPTVIYTHQLGTTIGGAIADLELICRTLEPGELREKLLYLPF